MVKIILITLVIIVILLPILWVLGNYCFVSLFVLIITWSNEGDVVFDPFMGSGTTAKMAKLNNRNYIGFEISKEYCDIAEERLKEVKSCQILLKFIMQIVW